LATCLVGILLSVLATLVPSVAVIVVLWWLDRYEKEPLWLLSIVFFWGAVPTIILSLLAQLFVDAPLEAALGHSILYPLANMSIVAPLTEETFKALILLALFAFYRQEFNGVMDGILYGALVGFGFSVVEDVFYLMRGLTAGGGWGEWGATVALRVGLYNLNHSMFTACVGVGFGLALGARQRWQRWLYPLLGWMVAIVLHGIHNGGIVLADATSGVSCLILTFVDWMGVLGMAALIWIATGREKRRFEELVSEVEAGAITPGEYLIASTIRIRFRHGWHVLTAYGPLTWLKWNRYVQMIVDLAYRKHTSRVVGESATNDASIVRLRQRIAEVRPELPALG
jgi:RsiW-degrading membrane proteinase PrsW (M82 family)